MIGLLQAERTRLVRFGVSGLGSTALHTLVATALFALRDATPVTANAIAFLCATAFSYLANTLWSFSSTVRPRNALRFLAVTLAGFVETMLLARAAEALGASRAMGVVAIALLIPPTAFVLHRLWTYR
ncbi:GtrA family protein [Burkholderia cenocepacia]|uniref:GtrA family protein n=1 Tax=Burkholderia cenocepacia TaxID=95486 RepID=UPI000D81B41C|nr:GtrA family protein [Burkholderia cenocepacia]MCW5135668.1 GtrA family protein [Burkholderia cenocepacia]SPV13185.1 putative GtrA-like family protein [Burkholderia cenocepacia]